MGEEVGEGGFCRRSYRVQNPLHSFALPGFPHPINLAVYFKASSGFQTSKLYVLYGLSCSKFVGVGEYKGFCTRQYPA